VTCCDLDYYYDAGHRTITLCVALLSAEVCALSSTYIIIIIFASVGIFPKKEKLMKKIKVWSRHQSGWSDDKKTVVQKHRVKALGGD